MARRALPWLLLVYGAASLLHFWHNAAHLADYPNLPRWISATSVYAVWIATAMIGLSGYVLLRRQRLIGLGLLALYGALGLDGLLHYSRAPMSAHTFDMNVTIWTEVVAASLVLLVVFVMAAKPDQLLTTPR